MITNPEQFGELNTTLKSCIFTARYIKIMQEKIQSIKEINFNKNGMVPVPGTMQAEHQVTFIE